MWKVSPELAVDGAGGKVGRTTHLSNLRNDHHGLVQKLDSVYRDLPLLINRCRMWCAELQASMTTSFSARKGFVCDGKGRN
jgi:hypothetical protein